MEHATLFCPRAKTVWDAIREWSGIQLRRSSFRNTKLWLFDFLSRSFDKEATVLAVSFWHLWEAQNDARHSSEAPHPRITVEKIRSYTDLIL